MRYVKLTAVNLLTVFLLPCGAIAKTSCFESSETVAKVQGTFQMPAYDFWLKYICDVPKTNFGGQPIDLKTRIQQCPVQLEEKILKRIATSQQELDQMIQKFPDFAEQLEKLKKNQFQAVADSLLSTRTVSVRIDDSNKIAYSSPGGLSDIVNFIDKFSLEKIDQNNRGEYQWAMSDYPQSILTIAGNQYYDNDAIRAGVSYAAKLAVVFQNINADLSQLRFTKLVDYRFRMSPKVLSDIKDLDPQIDTWLSDYWLVIDTKTNTLHILVVDSNSVSTRSKPIKILKEMTYPSETQQEILDSKTFAKGQIRIDFKYSFHCVNKD